MPPIVPKTPNLFRLHGTNLQVIYSTSGFDGKPHLQYHDVFQTLHFSGDQIRTLPSEIGTLVTVTIRMTVDTGSTVFTLLVPHVNLEDESNTPVNITTYGFTTIRRFSIVQEFWDYGSNTCLTGRMFCLRLSAGARRALALLRGVLEAKIDRHPDQNDHDAWNSRCSAVHK